MKCIKKQRLIKKYELTTDKMLNDIHLMQIMKDDLEFRQYYSWIKSCEFRCLNRLKKL